MGIEKIIQYLNRKPTEEEIRELSALDVLNAEQAKELMRIEVSIDQSFQLREDQKLAIVQLGKEGIEFIDDDTGSGKTVVAIKGVQYLEQEILREPIKALFFSPNTIKSQWKRRISSYLPQGYIDPDKIVVIGEENGNEYDLIQDSRVTIINYERIAFDRSLINIIQQSGFRFVNFDEFQRAKNHRGKTSKHLKLATSGIPFRMATTASPYRKSLMEPANLLAILDPEYYEKEQQSEIENNPAYSQDYERMTPEEKEDLALFIIYKYVRGEGIADVGPLRSQYGRVKRKGIRKTTEELTGKVVSFEYGVGAYDLSEAETRIYEMFRNADFHFPAIHIGGNEKLELLRHVLRDVSVLTPEFVTEKIVERKSRAEQKSGREYSSVYTKLMKIFENYAEMRQLGEIESSRYKALRNVLANIGNEEEVVVFTDKKYEVVDRVLDILNEHYGPDSSVRITGDDSTAIGNGRYFSDRETAMLKLQVNESIKGGVVTRQTAGEGTRFDRVRNVVLFELPYTWDDTKQMVGRFQSPYQTRYINVYVINESTGLDQGIINLIEHRKKVGDRFLKGTEELSKEEILENLAQKSTASEPEIRPYLQSDLRLLLTLLGSMRDKGFKENYRIFQETEIGGEKASKFFARVYESFLENSLPGNMSRLITQVIKGLGGTGKLADMGSATAFLGRNIMENKLSISVTNLDINYDALKHGMQVAEEKCLRQEYVVSDMGRASFRTNRFNYTIASMSLNHQSLDERVESLKELFRITKTGGYVIIAEKGHYLTESQKKRYLAGLEALGGRAIEISGFYTAEEGNFNAFVAVAQKDSEPSADINPEDFLYNTRQIRGYGKAGGEWRLKGQRCEMFIHEDGTHLQDKIKKYKVKEQQRIRVLNYDIIVLSEPEAKEYHLHKYGTRLQRGTSFISVEDGKAFVYQPNVDMTKIREVARDMLLDYQKAKPR